MLLPAVSPRVVVISFGLWLGCTSPGFADVESGPPAGEAVPELEVAAVTGDFADQAVDYTERRGEQPTVYVVIPADKWSRPTARLLRKLDEAVPEALEHAEVVAVWLTADVAKSKEYLQVAQSSLKLQNTALTVFEGDAAGPGEWGINPDADVTVVVAKAGKVATAFGYVSANETLADDIISALKRDAEK